MKVHHANMVVGEGDFRNFVFDILKNDLGFEVQKNPDFLIFESESFGIDEARNLGVWAIGKPLASDIKVALLIVKSITAEAQNALLKVLEEPTPGTYFFISIENLGNILNTFLSRVRVIKNNSDSNIEIDPKSDAMKFLKSDIGGRFAMIRNLVKKEDKNIMKDLIKSLEETAYQNNSLDMKKKMKKILIAKVFASARGSSPKMLLEWLSCML